jgi:hypothetical protein
MDLVAEWDQVQPPWWQEKKDKVMNRSLHAGFVMVQHKIVSLLG